MQEYLENIDKIIFLTINNARSAFLDSIIPYATQFPFWSPLFAVAIYFLYKKFRQKLSIVLVCFAVLISITDPVSNLIKKSVKRYRPSHNIELAEKVKTIDGYKGGQFGFVSGHAANSFGIVVLLLLLLKGIKNWIKLLILSWAFFICYTRIYLGVHYPSDLVVGALIGISAAYITYQLFLFLDKTIYKNNSLSAN